MKLEQIPFHAIRGAQTADGGWTFKAWTPELRPEQVMYMATIGSRPGWLLAKANELKLEDIPTDEAPIESGLKTPSQRLRAVLFRVWEAKGSKEAFDTYYIRVMDQLIERFKQELEP